MSKLSSEFSTVLLEFSEQCKIPAWAQYKTAQSSISENSEKKWKKSENHHNRNTQTQHSTEISEKLSETSEKDHYWFPKIKVVQELSNSILENS